MVQIALAVLAVLAVLVLPLTGCALLSERWVRTSGLARGRRQLAAQLGTDALQLEVTERPLLLALLRRRGTEVAVRADDVPVGDGALIRTLTARIVAVRAEPRARALRTGAGTFSATIDERELGHLVRLPGVVSRLELTDAGLRIWTILGVGLDADVLVNDGALRVIPDPAQLAPLLRLPGIGAFRRTIEGTGLRVELPDLPFGAIVETVDVSAGTAVATGRLPEQRLPLR